MTKRLLLTLAAFAVGLLMIAPAFAAGVTAVQNTTVFQQPDQGSAVVTSMPAGTTLNSVGCSNGWCVVQTPLGSGYVLSGAVAAAAGSPPPRGNGPGFSFNFGIGNNNPPPRPPNNSGGGGGHHNGGGFGNNNDDMVCFYERNDFGGKSFCAEPGDASDQLPRSWNDRISSIEVYGEAEVEVCRDSDMEGTCSVIRRDTSRLPTRLNERISSFEVN